MAPSGSRHRAKSVEGLLATKFAGLWLDMAFRSALELSNMYHQEKKPDEK
jgi:hypothetical protein